MRAKETLAARFDLGIVLMISGAVMTVWGFTRGSVIGFLVGWLVVVALIVGEYQRMLESHGARASRIDAASSAKEEL